MSYSGIRPKLLDVMKTGRRGTNVDPVRRRMQGRPAPICEKVIIEDPCLKVESKCVSPGGTKTAEHLAFVDVQILQSQADHPCAKLSWTS